MIQETFNEVYKKWYPFVYGICFSFLKDRDNAISMADDTFVVVNDLMKLHQFETEGKLKAFMAITAKNKCLNFLKRIKSTYKLPIVFEEAEPKEYEQPIENQLIYSEVVCALLKQAQELPNYCGKVFVKWVCNNKKPIRELAEELNISVNTFNNLQQKSVRIIKRMNGIKTTDHNLSAAITGKYKSRTELEIIPEIGTSMKEDVLNFARINQYLMTTQEIGEEMVRRYPFLNYQQVRRWLRDAGIKPVTKGDFYREFIAKTKCSVVEFAEKFNIDEKNARTYFRKYSA